MAIRWVLLWGMLWAMPIGVVEIAGAWWDKYSLWRFYQGEIPKAEKSLAHMDIDTPNKRNSSLHGFVACVYGCIGG